MDSILDLLAEERSWEDFLTYRLMKGRFDWCAFDDMDSYVARKGYLGVVQRLQHGEGLSVPTRHLVNKMGSGKKRVVYSFAEEEMRVLKAMAFLLYRYDGRLADNCYSFRRGLTAHDAIRRLSEAINEQPMWAYKVDIHNYFNSISVELLLPLLGDLLADDPQLYDFFKRMLTDGRARVGESIVSEERGVMAGTPTSPFLANVYLSEVDHYFAENGVLYARYSDDIILFAPDKETLDNHINILTAFITKYRLEINPEKVRIYEPGEAFDFLGFKCQGRSIDISDITRRKMKDKIRRKAHALQRWRSKKNIDSEKAMVALIRHFNRKFFDEDEQNGLSWSRWFFPIINETAGLKEIDHYLQAQLRYVATGRHNKANFRVRYDRLKELGYQSLVHAFFSV